ncbi:outer membrane receptor protein [Flammeovirgaceae bacterium 311]|nr:outer membrane receptor protein [Flammeovirgaceae bacterium 311]
MKMFIQHILLICLLFTLPVFAFAQQIQVIDINTRVSIPGVTILNESKSRGILTDADGKADLSQLPGRGTLIFRHSSYLEKRMSRKEIQDSNGIVELAENVVQIQEVVVSANRWEQRQEDIPHDIVSISARDIALQNPQTTADMLHQSGEVFVQKSQQGGGSPMLRGFAANSVLLVVDGVRMNNAIYRSGNLQNIINLDANVLEGAEVIFGPGSVMYGSDALGGVIDFHTKSPLLNTGKGLRTEGSAMARYATANREKTAHADVSLGFSKIAALSSITLSDFDDLRAGKQGMENYPAYFLRPDYVERIEGRDVMVLNPDPELQLGSGYEQLNLLQKIRYTPTENTDLLYSFHYSTSSNIPRYDRLTQRSQNNGRTGELRFAEWYYGPQKWMLHSLQANFYKKRRWFEQLRITTAYQQYHESRHSRRQGQDWRENQFEAVDVLTLNADFDKPLPAGTRLFYGAETALNFVNSTAREQNILSGAENAIAPRYGDQGNDTQSFSAYASMQHPINQYLMLNAGARVTYYQLLSRFSNIYYSFPFEEIKLRTAALNGNAGIAYAKEGLRFDLLVSTGFRAPNIDDVSKIFDPAPNTVTVPNPDLQPENSYNAESSIGYEGNRFRASVTAYASLLKNVIVRRPFLFNGQDSLLYQGDQKAVEALVNTGSGRVAGASFNIRYKAAEHLLLSSVLTYTWGEDRDSGERLRHIPPLFGQTSLTYQRKTWSAILQLRYNGKIAWQNLPLEEQSKGNIYAPEGAKAWIVADIRANWKPLDYLEISSGLENITDTHYRTYSSGISAAGRNLYISLRSYL